MAQAALESKVEAFLAQHAARVDDQARRLVLQRVKFSSSILHPYPRKSHSIEELIPWLNLKGISTGDFSEAFSALSVPKPAPSARTRYAYLWADGISAKVGLEDDPNSRQCLLVLMGATAECEKELIAVVDGFGESKQNWMELLLDLKQHGLAIDPKLAIGNGALKAKAPNETPASGPLSARYLPSLAATLLGSKDSKRPEKMPKSVQPQAKADPQKSGKPRLAPWIKRRPTTIAPMDGEHASRKWSKSRRRFQRQNRTRRVAINDIKQTPRRSCLRRGG